MLKKIFFVFIIIINLYPLQTLANDSVMIYLTGLPGTGKYTIAKEISKNGYKLVDNHLINNPLFSLLDPESYETPKGMFEKINQIRNIVFNFIEEDYRSNYVLTNALMDDNYHRDIYNNLLRVASNRHSIFIPVQLKISDKERAKRIVRSERLERFKTTDVDEVYVENKILNIRHENLLVLDVTKLSAKEASEKIMAYVKKFKDNY